MNSRAETMNLPKGDRLPGRSSGFTLLELVLATLISSLVIGIFSVALSVSLRTWERQQNREISEAPTIIDLLKRQLSQFEPVSVQFEGKQRPIFQGNEHSLAFATGYSVRAISKGIPVIVRYIFVPERGALYYAELPLDPYHPKPIQQFLQMSPGQSKTGPNFYLFEVTTFALSYATEEKSEFAESLDDEADVPPAVRVSCSSRGDSTLFSALMFVNSPFGESSEEANPIKAEQTSD